MDLRHRAGRGRFAGRSWAVFVIASFLFAVVIGPVPATAKTPPAGPRAAESPAPGQNPVLLGDSLTMYAYDELMQQVEATGVIAPIVLARGGVTLEAVEALAYAVVDQGWPVLALALGTNDAYRVDALGVWRRALRRLDASDSCIAVIRAHRAPGLSDDAISFLDNLDRLFATYPDVRVLDWDAVAVAYPAGHVDGVHHDQQLQTMYADILWQATNTACA